MHFILQWLLFLLQFAVIILLLVGLSYLIRLNEELCSYWRRRGVFHYSATSIFSSELSKCILIQYPKLAKIYRFAGDSRYCGFFQFRKPTLLVKDPTAVSAILTRDSRTFLNKRDVACTQGKVDPLSYHLLALNGEHWSKLRSKLSPAFTPDKLKAMFDILDKTIDKFLVELESSTTEKDGEATEVRELSGRLAIDCIASCVFGLRLNCVNSNINRIFMKMSGEPFKAGLWPLTKAHLRTLHPRLFRLLPLQAYSKEVADFFTHLVGRLLRTSGGSTTDFLSLLGKVWQTEDDTIYPGKREDVIAAQVFSFFVGGFETSSITLGNTLFELSKRPEIVTRIRVEISEVVGEGSLTYEHINNLKYLASVIDETLRLYPPVFYVQRVASESYLLPDSDIVIERGMEVVIPILELHRDPRYFPNPEEFDPERFSPGNKCTLLKGSYIPFGDGPRKCIGSRFSLLELKLALCKIVMNFNLCLDPSMPQFLSFEEYSRIFRVKHDILIKFTKRNCT